MLLGSIERSDLISPMEFRYVVQCSSRRILILIILIFINFSVEAIEGRRDRLAPFIAIEHPIIGQRFFGTRQILI